MSFLDLQEVAKAKRERDFRLRKIPSATVIPFFGNRVALTAEQSRDVISSTSIVPEQPPEPVVVPLPVVPQKPGAKYPSLNSIILAVSLYYDIPRNDIISHRRFAALAHARQVIYYLARELTIINYPTLARILDRDHTTCLHGVQKITRLKDTDEKLAQDLINLRSMLGAS